MHIGPYQLKNNVILAPMAGVTDLPFRSLCHRLGAGMVVSEMVSANPQLRHTLKTQRRRVHLEEAGLRAIQIAGGDAAMLADAAKFNADLGAQLIDINMGCPAKTVCNKAAGSALLKDEKLVADILTSVVNAVNIPVTLKIRTGWDPQNKNGLRIAKIAENEGIQALAVHGRTRACRYQGVAEYDTTASIKAHINIPIIANGDITSPKKAKAVLQYTKADAVMLGRSAQGNPWIFQQVAHFLATNEELPTPTPEEIRNILTEHLRHLYKFYGEYSGVRIARKHVGWYCKEQPDSTNFRKQFNALTDPDAQLTAIERYLHALDIPN